MNQDDKRIPTKKYHGGKITSGFVVTAVTMLLFILLLLVLMKLGVIGTPAFLQNILGTGENPAPATENIENDLPDFSSDGVRTEDRYYTFSVDPREILASLTEREAYVREFRVMNFYGEESDISKYTLTVSGERYRLESDHKMVICDGETACTITGTYRSKLNDTVFTLENEIGITPLSAVKTAADKGSVTFHSDGDKTLSIVSEDAETGVLSEYVVSIETGIVMSERSYLDGELYRAVVTDVVDVFGAEADDLPDDYFEIPDFDNP